MDESLSLNTRIVVTARRAGLRSGADNVVELLLRLQAPDAPPGHAAQRAPQALALVVDRSGSMAGQPLAEARRCADHLIGSLRASDRVALVQFDGQAKLLWPAHPLGDAQALRAALAGMQAGGQTNLHGGWLAGARALGDVGGQGLRRVMLLSDGCANVGETGSEAIAAQCAEWAARGVTTSTYGLGRNFNEDLMLAMARAGGGNAYYGDGAEDLMEPFEQELSLLGNLCLRELRLAARPGEGIALRLLNDLPHADGRWQWPDLAWGAEAWAVLRLNVPRDALPPTGRPMRLLHVEVDARTPAGEPVRVERVALSLPVLGVGAFDALADDEAVTRRIVEVAAGDALARIRVAADAGDWPGVERRLDEAMRQFDGNAWVAAMLQAMREIAATREARHMKKELLFASRKLHVRLSAIREGDLGGPDAQADVQAFLRRKPVQGKGKP